MRSSCWSLAPCRRGMDLRNTRFLGFQQCRTRFSFYNSSSWVNSRLMNGRRAGLRNSRLMRLSYMRCWTKLSFCDRRLSSSGVLRNSRLMWLSYMRCRMQLSFSNRRLSSSGILSRSSRRRMGLRSSGLLWLFLNQGRMRLLFCNS